MSGAALVAIVASIGNLLQGWDNATISGKSCGLGRFVFIRHADDVMPFNFYLTNIIQP
jgi:hypothetical protein